MSNITSLSQLDLNKKYSYADYLTWQFEQAVEIIKGKILPMAAPSRKHQGISFKLSGIFYNTFEKHDCNVYAAPFDVRLYDKKNSIEANKDVYTVVQPDLCVICDEAKLDDKGCIGAPDLIVEILSPGNSAKEMRIKKDLYAESGVREYWIIDPEHENAFQFLLEKEDTYSPPTIYINEDVLDCHIFPDLKISLIKVFG
ncbi:MAG: Uma2 family endonuclease [Saprospiraceae bacterium]|nr:Uma2 family endonuclease [Saprospiraceae bacterium]